MIKKDPNLMNFDLRGKRKNIRCLTIVIILLFIIFSNYGNGLTYNWKYEAIEENVGIIGYDQILM
jgi:hypothetical protein